MDAGKPLLPPPPDAMFEPDTSPPLQPTFARASQPAYQPPNSLPPAAALIALSESSIDAALETAARDHAAQSTVAVPEPVRPTITRQYVQLASATEAAVEPSTVPAQVVAVVTEDAEAIRVNERRDTSEAPPMRVAPIETAAIDAAQIDAAAIADIEAAIEATPIEVAPPTDRAAMTGETGAFASEVVAAAPSATVPATISFEETIPQFVPIASPAVQAEPAVVATAAPTEPQPDPAIAAELEAAALAAQQKAHADQVARERGVTPIRVPSVSKRYDIAAPARTSRSLLIGAIAFGGICVAVTAGTIMWARGAVSRAEQAARQPTVAPNQAAQANAAQETPDTPDTFGVQAPAAIDKPVAAAVDEPIVDEPVVEPTDKSVEPTAKSVEPTAKSVEATAKPVEAIAPAKAAVVMPDPKSGVAGCSVAVKSNVRGAAVFLNGKARGTTPAVIPAPCNKPAVVEIRHGRYDDFKQQVKVGLHQVQVDARLERDKTALTLWSDPPGAQVTYNGVALGKTPLVAKINRFEAGTLWFRAPGRAPDWRKIVPKEKTKTVSITLKPAP